MHDHNDVPSTFDGEIPELAFGEDNESRLLIGQYYLIKDDEGIERPWLLTSASVNELECTATCTLSLSDGRSGIYTWPLSDTEMAAWKRHPDTFFGKSGQRTTECNNALELYDFFLNSFQETPRERLLELMSEAPDIDKMLEFDQPTLASIYAEYCVNAAYLNNSKI